MLKKFIALLIVPTLSLALFSKNANSDVITLHVPIVEESTQLHLFYHELLETAINEIGHTPKLITPSLPQLRIKNYLDHGLISIYWMIESVERNKQYIPIEVDLTNQLISKRILFIKKGDQHLYQEVQNLEDFRNLNLVAKIGKKWFDAEVWQANNLAYNEDSGSWKQIFRMIAQGNRHHYFPRGINEITVEAQQYPDLAIEKRLLFIYDRDFHFYLSKQGVNAGSRHKKVIEQALKTARESGLIDRLTDKYWGRELKKLNYKKRIKIRLTPPK